MSSFYRNDALLLAAFTMLIVDLASLLFMLVLTVSVVSVRLID